MIFDIIFSGIIKNEQVDLNDYDRFMISQLVSQLDDFKYIKEVNEINKLKNISDEEHFKLLQNIIPNKFLKTWRKPHIFKFIRDIKDLKNKYQYFNNKFDSFEDFCKAYKKLSTKEIKNIEDFITKKNI